MVPQRRRSCPGCPGGAALIFRPVGSGAGGAGPLPLAQPDGRGASAPEPVVRAWANAAQQGDIATALTLMGNSGGWDADYWRGRMLKEHADGLLDSYTITRLAAAGQSTTAMVHWTGQGERDLCVALQVGPDGRVTVLEDFHWCRANE